MHDEAGTSWSKTGPWRPRSVRDGHVGQMGVNVRESGVAGKLFL